MISRDTIHAAEAMTASHAAIFQIRAAEYDRTPANRPIARAIAAAALKRERAALAWAADRLATIRKYAAYEGIAGETRTPPARFQPIAVDAAQDAPAVVDIAPFVLDDATIALSAEMSAAQDAPIVVDIAAAVDAYADSIADDSPLPEDNPRSVPCPRCAAAAGQRCQKDGRPQTRNHDARRAAHRAAYPASYGDIAPAVVDAAPIDRAIRSGETRRPSLPGGRDNSRSGRMTYAREHAKTTPPALRTPAQDALIQIKAAYAALLTERYNLRQAENADADEETITALRSMARDAETRYNELAAIAQPAIDSAV